MKNNANPWNLIAIALVTALIVGGGFWLYQNREIEGNETPDDTTNVEEATMTHTSEPLTVSFEYPKEWTVYEDQSSLAVQPNDGIPSNYFELDIEESITSENPTLQELIEKWNLEKADFTIDGQDVYTSGKQEDSELLSFYFEHNNKVYVLRTSTYGYEMTEVQLMISSLKLL